MHTCWPDSQYVIHVAIVLQAHQSASLHVTYNYYSEESYKAISMRLALL